MNNRRGCSKHPIHDFPGGYFKRKLTVFEQMDQLGIMNDPLIDRYYPYSIVKNSWCMT